LKYLEILVNTSSIIIQQRCYEHTCNLSAPTYEIYKTASKLNTPNSIN